MEYKKSYKGLILWVFLFCFAMFGCAFLPIENEGILMSLVMNVCCWCIVLLTYIIYRTENIYWYNGITFEVAEKAGTQTRKDYAWEHLRLFSKFALYYTAYSVIAHLLRINSFIDIAVMVVGLTVVAVCTMKIKL